jgi:hypothetical protein
MAAVVIVPVTPVTGEASRREAGQRRESARQKKRALLLYVNVHELSPRHVC